MVMKEKNKISNKIEVKGQLARKFHKQLARYFQTKADPQWNQSWIGENRRPFLELPFHLARSNTSQLIELLFDFNWLQAKTNLSLVYAIFQDYNEVLHTLPTNHPQRRSLELLLEGIWLSSHVITMDKNQLASQLLGRMSAFEHPKIKLMLTKAEKWHGASWLRPLNKSLAAPGGPLVRILDGHESDVTALDISNNGVNIAYPYEETIRVCDVTGNGEVLTLRGHTNSVFAVKFSVNGEYLFSLQSNEPSSEGKDNLIMWSLTTGLKVASLTVECCYDTPVLIFRDEQYILTSTNTFAILWRLIDGLKVRTFKFSKSDIISMALSPDQKYFFAGHEDGDIVMFDLDNFRRAVGSRGRRVR